MTREELKRHCQMQIEGCETWARYQGEEPSGKIYEEHNLILELLEHESSKGEWIKKNNDYFDWYECSECGYGSDGEMRYSREYDVRTNYCPNCGSYNGGTVRHIYTTCGRLDKE